MLTKLLKRIAERLWLRQGMERRVLLGPYRGLVFRITPLTRKGVFYHYYEPEVSRLLAAIVRPDMVVFDIGGHIGIHALYCAKLLRGRGRVVALEPWPENYQQLLSNVGANARLAEHIEVLPYAIGAQEGTAAMTAGNTDGKHHLTRAGERSDLSARITTVDRVREEHGANPALLLVDVEGAEMDVLNGATKTIRDVRPHVIVEHHSRKYPEHPTELAAWLRERGYSVEAVGERHLYARPTE